MATGRSPFVGRERELAALVERLAEAARGEGGVVFISGEPGIGKSRLLREIASRARAGGWLVLSGRAYDIDGMPPYLPFVEILGEHLRHSSDESLVALLSGAPELCLLLPELRTLAPGLRQAPSPGPEGDRFRLFEAVSEVLINLARQTESNGLLVLIDDLQWADRTSALLLQHLARKLGSVRLLVAAGYRTTEVDPAHHLHGVLADLAREHLCEQILLPPLDEKDAFALIHNLAGPSTGHAFASNLHRETGGNPFCMEEVVRDLIERGSDLSDASNAGQNIPAGVRAVIEGRLARLAAGTNEALQLAAVLGNAFRFDLFEHASVMDAQAQTQAIEEAERSGLLQEERDGYAFAHPLIRRTVYDDLSAPRRRQLHLRAAEAMERFNKKILDSDLAIVGHHWMSGGSPECATGYLLRAGDAALALTAWEEAARHWEAALECMNQTGEPPARRARLLEGLGDLYFLGSFEAHPSVERYVQAATLYERAGDLVGAARARSRAGQSLAYPTSGFDYAGALKHLRAAEKVLSAEPESVELGELYAAIAHAEAHALQNGPGEMVGAMRHVGEIAEKLDNEFLRDFLRVQSQHLQGHYLGLQGHLSEGLAREEQACDMASALKEKGGLVSQWPEKWNEYLLAYSGDEPLVANETSSLQFWRVHSRAGLVNFTTNCCGWQLLELNDPVGARAKHERIRDAQGRFLTPFLLYDLFMAGDVAGLRQLVAAGTSALSTFNPETMPNASSMLDLADGHWPQFQEAYAERTRKFRAAGSKGFIVLANRMLLRAGRATSDLKGAESLAGEALQISLTSGAVKYEFYSRAELSLLCAQTGRLSEAGLHLARCREILADGEDWRGLAGRAFLAEAVLAAGSGRHEEAEAHFSRAVERFHNLTLPWDEAEAFEMWAGACQRFHRGRSRRSFISEKLGSARAVYERIGAGQPWLDRLDAEGTHLSGADARTAVPAFPHGLTEREVEVLRLVADGRSNREIGEELVLSVRTVERHIANLYLKTGTHGRVEAASYAQAYGLAARTPGFADATD